MTNRHTRFRALIVGVTLVALVATGCRWNFEVLDGEGGPNGRVNHATGAYGTAIEYNGRPHVFYSDMNGDANLRHAYWNGRFWAFETLDGNGGGSGRRDADLGWDASAVVSGNRLRVFYYDRDDKALRHAYYIPGAGWGFETLDGNGGGGGRTAADVGHYAAALEYLGKPQVFYYDNDNGHLRRGWWNGSTWSFEIFDGDFDGARGRIDGDVGVYGNDAAVYDWVPHVFYFDITHGYLRHAYWNGAVWVRETLDGDGFDNGRVLWDVGLYPSLVMYNGRPHVFYTDTHLDDLRHGYNANGAWFFETLDGHRNGPNGQTTNRVGTYPATTLVGGRPNVWYHDANTGTQRRAWWTGTVWRFADFDGLGGPDGQVDHPTGWDNIAVTSGGTPRVFSYDSTDGTLRHAWFG